MKTMQTMAAAAVAALILTGCAGAPRVTVSAAPPSPGPVGDVTVTSAEVSQGLMDSYPALHVRLRVHNPTVHTSSYLIILGYEDRTGTRVDTDYSRVSLVAPGRSALSERGYGGISPGDLHGAVSARVISVERTP